MFRQTMHGVSIIGSQWPRIQKSNGVEHSTTMIRLSGTDRWAMPNSGVAAFELRLTRQRLNVNGRRLLARTFRASVMTPGLIPVQLGVGQCRTWEEAVDAAQAFDVVAVIKAHGQKVYDREHWKLVRPFHVVYPWEDPQEPNAKMSPFKLCGDWRLEDDDAGCIAMQYSPTKDSMRQLAVSVGANAFLVNEGEKLLVYHSDGMREAMPITIDDFHARLIAGVDTDYQ